MAHPLQGCLGRSHKRVAVMGRFIQATSEVIRYTDWGAGLLVFTRPALRGLHTTLQLEYTHPPGNKKYVGLARYSISYLFLMKMLMKSGLGSQI